MKNYFVYCLFSKQTKFNGTLLECIKEIKHAGGFGIASISTGELIPLVTKPMDEMRLSKRLVNNFPKSYSKLRYF